MKQGKDHRHRILAVVPQTHIENTILLDGVMNGTVNAFPDKTYENFLYPF